jgi:hypothetical protein
MLPDGMHIAGTVRKRRPNFDHEMREIIIAALSLRALLRDEGRQS